MNEVPYLYALCYSHIWDYSFHSTDDYIDGSGPRVRIEDGVLFERNYFWAMEGWQYDWVRDNDALRYR